MFVSRTFETHRRGRKKDVPFVSSQVVIKTVKFGDQSSSRACLQLVGCFRGSRRIEYAVDGTANLGN